MASLLPPSPESQVYRCAHHAWLLFQTWLGANLISLCQWHLVSAIHIVMHPVIGSVQRLTGVERRKQSVGSCEVRPACTPLAGFITPRVRDYQDITLQVTVDPTTTQDPGSHEC